MPASIFYHMYPEKSNRITWYILIAVFILAFFGFLYSKIFLNTDMFYQKDYYERISGIRIPQSSSVLESHDNGEFYTASTFRLDKDSLNQFIKNFGFHSDSSHYKPKMFAESVFKIQIPEYSSTQLLYNYGSKGKNSWVYIIDSKRSLMWAEIQYPDWAGD